MSGVSKKSRSLKIKADAAYVERKWQKALDLYEKLIEEMPKEPRTLQRMGDLHRRLGENSQAVSRFKQVASIYSDQGFWAKAIAMNKLILQIDPDDRLVQNKLAQMYAQRETEEKTDPGFSIPGQPILTTPLPDDAMIGGTIELSPLGLPLNKLERVPLLSEMNPDELVSLLEQLAVRQYPAGTLVCEEGDVGKSMYIIADGWVEVFARGKKGDRIALAKLRGGDFFGEFGLLTNGQRNASVQAITDLELLEITEGDFKKISEKHPRVWKALEEYVRRRLIVQILAKSDVFTVLTPEERDRLANLVTPRKHEMGEVVMGEGTPGEEMFFVKTGTLLVTLSQGKENVVVGELHPGDYFGETAMLTGKPRTATVTSKTPCQLFALARKDAAVVLKHNRDVLLRLKSRMEDRSRENLEVVTSFREARSTLNLV